MSGTEPPVSDATINELAHMARVLFTTPHEEERRQARAAMAGFSIAPQNVTPFLYVMTKTQDPYALQFVLQSLRRIVTRHWKQIDSSNLPHICSVSIDFLASYAHQLPRYLVAAASQLIARTLKAAWLPAPAAREFASTRLATLLPRSPQHCLVVISLWSEILAEFSPRRRVEASAKLADVSLGESRRATVAFGNTEVTPIINSVTEVLSRIVSGTLTFDLASANSPGASAAMAALPGAALSLMQSAMRYDFHGMSPDDWAEDSEQLILPNSLAWRAVVESPDVLNAIISLLPGPPPSAGTPSPGEISAGETTARALDVITTFLSVRSSSWSTQKTYRRIVRQCLLGVLPLLSTLATPCSEAGGTPLLADEEETLAAVGRFLIRISIISWIEVMDALAPNGGGPLRLVSLASRGPSGALEGLRALPVPGAQFEAGETVAARAVTAEHAVIDTSPLHGAQGDESMHGSSQAKPPLPGDVLPCDAIALFVSVMQSFTRALIAAAVADPSAPSVLLSAPLGYTLAFWAKAADSCTAGLFPPSIHDAVLDASLAAVAGVVDARLGFVDATCSRPGTTVAAASSRLSDLVQEPGFSEQLLPLAMICRHYPAGAARSLVAALDSAAATFRELLSQADAVAAAATGRGRGMQAEEYALRMLACETRLSFLIALSAAILAPNRLGGPRPAAINAASSLVFGSSPSDHAGLVALRALFGITLPSLPHPTNAAAPAPASASVSATSPGLTGSALFAALDGKGQRSTHSGKQKMLDVAETVLTVTVWSLLPLLPVRLGVLTAAEFSNQSSLASRGTAALKTASAEGGSPATLAAASAGAGATQRVLVLLAAEPVPVDPSTGAPRQAPGWSASDGVFFGAPLDGLPPPVDLAAERVAAGFCSSTASAGCINPPLGAGSITAVPIVNSFLPPRSASLDRALLTFVQAFTQRYCSVSQLRVSGTATAAPVFTAIGDAISWIRPLPAAGTTAQSDDDNVTFFGEGGDWNVPQVFAAMFPAPGSGSGQSRLAHHVTFNSRDAVDVIISLISGAIYSWSHPAHRDEAALGAALELLHDISGMHSISRSLLGLPATAALINAHTASPLGRDASLAPYRRLFYECVTRIITHSRPSVPRIQKLLLTFDATFGALCMQLQSPTPAAHAPALALGLCTALHGVFEACDSHLSYTTVFSWAFPDYVSLLTRAVEAWWGDGTVLEALLDLFVEMSENRFSRIYFTAASPDAALFYKACVLVIETYCSRAVRVKAPEMPGARKSGGLGINESGAVADNDDDDDDDDGDGDLGSSSTGAAAGSSPVQQQRRYATKLQAVQSCLDLAYRALSGFCPLGAFVAFGDHAVDNATAAILGVVASLDRGDVLGRPELALSLFSLLETTFDTIPTAILRVPQHVFVAIIRILSDAVSTFSSADEGTPLFKVYILAAEALSHLFRYSRTASLAIENTARDQAFSRGGAQNSVSRARRSESMNTMQLLKQQMAASQPVLTDLLAHVVTQFVFETGEVHGSLMRVVLPFIYTCSEAWEKYVHLLANTAPAAAAADALSFDAPVDPSSRVQMLLFEAHALMEAAKRVFEDPDDTGVSLQPPPSISGSSDDEDSIPVPTSQAATKALMNFREVAVKLFRRPDGF